MKHLLPVFFAALIIVSFNAAAFAQKGRTEEERANDRYQESLVDEAERNAFKDLRKPRNPSDNPSPKEKEELDRQARINRITFNIEELNKANASLSSAAQTAQNDKSAKKKAEKLAKKIAGLSKDLRKEIGGAKSSGKVAPALPVANVGISGSVENIDKLVKEVTQEKERLLYTVDLALVKESSKKLELIESQALGIAAVLR